MCRSVPQIATESTLHSTSGGPGFGTGTSSRISWRLGPVRTTARIVVGNASLRAPVGAAVVVLTSGLSYLNCVQTTAMRPVLSSSRHPGHRPLRGLVAAVHHRAEAARQ